MTRKQLNKYKYILQEAEEQLRRLEKIKDCSADTVRGSSSRYPYAEHRIRVSGSPAKKRLEEQINISIIAAIKTREEIEAFIQSVPDPHAREIMRSKYIDGLTWKEAAEKNYVAPVTAKNIVKRILIQNDTK